MNIYIVVEGETAAKKILTSWIQFVNPKLKPIDYPDQFTENNFYVLAGFGQPGIWNIVRRAISDVNNNLKIDRFVICVDSEDRDLSETYLKAKSEVESVRCRVEVKYAIQHFCLETWFLGNKTTFRKNAQDPELKKYLTLFDVKNHDPESLPAYPEKSWNRSQFAYNYFRAGIKDKYVNKKSYSKHNPGIVVEIGFFNQVKERCLSNKHIQSFNGFLDAFI